MAGEEGLLARQRPGFSPKNRKREETCVSKYMYSPQGQNAVAPRRVLHAHVDICACRTDKQGRHT